MYFNLIYCEYAVCHTTTLKQTTNFPSSESIFSSSESVTSVHVHISVAKDSHIFQQIRILISLRREKRKILHVLLRNISKNRSYDNIIIEQHREKIGFLPMRKQL